MVMAANPPRKRLDQDRAGRDRYLLDPPLDLVVLRDCHAFVQKPHRPSRHGGVNPITGRRTEAVLMNSRSPGGFPDQGQVGLHLVGGAAIVQLTNSSISL